ncbi:transposase family protein [Streptomyces sp. NPDC001890]|uniref:transposase family protein n=1 Tax=Streptomyces sp. NPDC001890 TaxID=3364620 RepID=UPI003694C7D3
MAAGARPGPGRRYELVFADRALITLVYLRTGLTHDALAALYEVGSSTIGRAVGEIRSLLAMRGLAVPDRSGLRLRTLEDVFAYAEAEAVTLRVDGTETQVRRPPANRPGRSAFISGKRRQNTIKTTTISDHQGRTLWSGAERPGRMHDQTALRTEGLAEQLRYRLRVKAEVDEGYRGLANEIFPTRSRRRRGNRKPRRRTAEREVRMARNAPPPVLPPDLRRARRRRTQAVASAAAIHRTPRNLRRHSSGHRRARLRPRSQARHPTQDEHRTRARLRDGLLNHPPAEPPDPHAPISIAGQAVSLPTCLLR